MYYMWIKEVNMYKEGKQIVESVIREKGQDDRYKRIWNRAGKQRRYASSAG